MSDENALKIYIDGSSKGNPRRGGIGIRFVYIDGCGEEVSEDLENPGYISASNNEMELCACVIGLKYALSDTNLRLFHRMIILTDSNYVFDNYKKALFVWPKSKWLRREGAPVLNVDLWKDFKRNIEKAYKARIRVDIQKVKGHSKDIHNRAADKMAKKSAEYPSNKALTPETIRRKLSSEETTSGSVEMLGQRATIRVIGEEYLRTQKLNRYRYEIMSKGSPYYRKVDFAFSTELLRAGHVYSVRFNKEKNNPRILKLLRKY